MDPRGHLRGLLEVVGPWEGPVTGPAEGTQRQPLEMHRWGWGVGFDCSKSIFKFNCFILVCFNSNGHGILCVVDAYFVHAIYVFVIF